MKEERKSLFTPENLVMGVLLGGLAWGGTQIITIKEAQATLVSQQVENSRVNEIVYEVIPSIQLSLNTLSNDQKHMNNKMDGLFTVVSNIGKDPSNANSLSNELILKYNGTPPTE